MNEGQIITTVIIGFVFLALIAYDIYALINKSSKNDTLSYMMLKFAWKIAVIPYFSGVLTGHFFIPIESLKGFFQPWIFISALVSGMGISLLLRLTPWYYPFIPCIFGIIMGAVFWNQG